MSRGGGYKCSLGKAGNTACFVAPRTSKISEFIVAFLCLLNS